MDKVYVVSTGSYSDWSIRGIFKNLEKAECYNKLINDANDIEEYELADDLIITPVYYISCYYSTKDIPFSVGSYSYDIGRLYKTKGDFRFNIEKTNSRDDEGCEWKSNHTSYSEYDGDIGIWRSLRSLPTNDEETKSLEDKYHKVCLDLAAFVEYEKANGATDKQISELIKLQ
jgi:hypothetical protein